MDDVGKLRNRKTVVTSVNYVIGKFCDVDKLFHTETINKILQWMK